MMPDMTNFEINKDPLSMLDDMPDIASELDLFKLKRGTLFYARFILDPKGGSDSLRWARDHIGDLKSGRMARQNIGRDYWNNGTYIKRPPLATYLGDGRFKIIET